MALKLVTLPEVTVITAGTSVPISNNSIAIRTILIQADYNNSGLVYIGDSTVSSSNGVAIGAGGSVGYSADIVDPELNLSDYYIDSQTDGNIVHVSYQTNR